MEYSYNSDSTDYLHYIIRLQDENGIEQDEESRLEHIEEFRTGFLRLGSINWSLAVVHTYTEEEKRKETKCGTKCQHIHVLYKKHKTSKGQKFIREFCRRRQLPLYERKVERLLGLAKYLLQGNGRTVLHETGKNRPDGLPNKYTAIHSAKEDIGYEYGSVGEGHESDWTLGEEDRESSSSKTRTCKTKAIRKATGSRQKELNKVETIKRLLLKYRCKDEPMLKRKMKEDEKEIFHEIMFESGREWTKLWNAAREEAMTSVMDMWWEDVLESLPDDQQSYSPPVMTVNKSLKVFTQILEKQGWDKEQRRSFLTNVYSVMNNNIQRKKRNTLYLIGKTSAGKSLIATSLELSKIFSFNSGEYNSRSSDFHFEDMALTCVAVINEPQIEPSKVDKFKIILEGGAFDTNVKFKSKSRVEGVPCIVTTNNEIYRYAPEAKEPFEERIYRWTFINKLDGFDITGGLHPKMWLTLLRYYQLNKALFNDDSDEEFDIAQFGGSTAALTRAAQSDYTENMKDGASEKARTLATAGWNHPDVQHCLQFWQTIPGEDYEADWEECCGNFEILPDFQDEHDRYNFWHAYANSCAGDAIYHNFVRAYIGFGGFIRDMDAIDVPLDDAGDDRALARLKLDADELWRDYPRGGDLNIQDASYKAERYYKGPPTDGAIERAHRSKLRRSICCYIIRLGDFLTGQFDTINRLCPDAGLILRETYHEQHNAIYKDALRLKEQMDNGDKEEGWVECSAGQDRNSRKRSNDSSDAHSSRVRDKVARIETVTARQTGRVDNYDELYYTAKIGAVWSSSIYICKCGWWICEGTDQAIDDHGRLACREYWLGSTDIARLGQECSVRDTGYFIPTIDRHRLFE